MKLVQELKKRANSEHRNQLLLQEYAVPESPSSGKINSLWERLPAAKSNDLPPPGSPNLLNLLFPDNRVPEFQVDLIFRSIKSKISRALSCGFSMGGKCPERGIVCSS